ncbi:hypothetical protein [Streptomyces sp. NPDC056549]|uniref:hypothetical protein n=1 Tax=Streptomyces sp. NPDC056549 TaxID=3345864 RepID=UPI0036972A0D
MTGRKAVLFKELICKGAAWGVAHPTLGMPSRRRRIARQETQNRVRAQVAA